MYNAISTASTLAAGTVLPINEDSKASPKHTDLPITVAFRARTLRPGRPVHGAFVRRHYQRQVTYTHPDENVVKVAEQAMEAMKALANGDVADALAAIKSAAYYASKV